MKERMMGRKMVKLSCIRGQMRGGDIEGDWVTMGVVINKTNPKTSANKANEKILEERFPCVDFTFDGRTPVNPDTLPSPRLIKIHLPSYSLLPQTIKDKKCKIVYVSRNSKDNFVSFYFFAKMLKSQKVENLSLKQWGMLFLGDKVSYGPYWKHNLSYWDVREEANILFIKYEDMKKDPNASIRKIAEYLGKELTEDQVDLIAEATSFKKMKTNPKANYDWLPENDVPETHKFMRKGQVGDWKNHFDDELSQKFDQAYKMNFGPSGLQHDFE
ncbi:PREDICTED: sulfotransferase 1A1-like [Priapulus caudatus]|uniref:Sulfotransferase 1A1-like n=1 Tax=Priapulus caudatus TaxID=37621 RepID=A0ABM1F2X5_PRICU|nr:PREDICTED: sulfotransferase 1A1-like [Priapulus caudatus]